MSYDQRCYDLAYDFLCDEPGIESHDALRHHASELAQDIQSTIESWIEHYRISVSGAPTEAEIRRSQSLLEFVMFGAKKP